MKLPQDWIAAGTPVTATASAKVTARINMSADVVGRGLCPECRKPMQVVTAGAHKVWACTADRVALPLPNEMLDEQAKEA